MIFCLEAMLGTRYQENTMQVANISKLESDLTSCEEKLKAALDDQQSIRDEYIGLSSELIYEFKLRNSNANLSYMSNVVFLESTLAQGKVLFESMLKAYQTPV
uniref:Uncharacterized protein n=1 Tax=Cannabis sativa TaxID=3483 RepID=A0A803Q741_CANSA